MSKYVPLNIPRRIAIEILRFFGGFAFGKTVGDVFGSIGVKLPEVAANFVSGATVPLNDKLGQYLQYYATNEAEANKRIFFDKMREAGISLEYTKQLYEGSWPTLLKLFDEQGKTVDANGLAKKADCNAREAEIMLNVYNLPTRIALVISGTNIVGIALAGVTTFYFPNALGLTNPLLQQVQNGIIGQLVSRVTEEAAPLVIASTANFFKSKDDEPGSPISSMTKKRKGGYVSPGSDDEHTEKAKGEEDQNLLEP